MNQISSLKLKKSIMRRVRAVWFLRRVTSPVFVKLYIFIILGWQFAVNVSLSNIFANAPGLSDLGKNLIFFTNAFANTELTIKLVLISILAIFIWLCFDVLFGRGKLNNFRANSV